jgi:hypothetical protein
MPEWNIMVGVGIAVVGIAALVWHVWRMPRAEVVPEGVLLIDLPEESAWPFRPAPAEWLLLEEDERRLAHELALLAFEGDIVPSPWHREVARRLADKTS